VAQVCQVQVHWMACGTGVPGTGALDGAA